MKKLILLVLTEKDVADLPAAIDRLKPLGLEGIWCIHNPHLGISDTTIEAKFADQIARLDAAVAEASRREDFDAAKGYKEQRDKVKIDRDLAVRDGWQKVPPEQRAEIQGKLFAGLDKSVAQNILITTNREVYQPEQTFEMLQKMRASWPAPVAMGTFVIGWPGSVALSHVPASVVTINKQATMTNEKPKAIAPKPKVPLTRDEELAKMGYFGLQHLAKKLGVELVPKMKNADLVAAIVAKENEAQAA